MCVKFFDQDQIEVYQAASIRAKVPFKYGTRVAYNTFLISLSWPRHFRSTAGVASHMLHHLHLVLCNSTLIYNNSKFRLSNNNPSQLMSAAAPATDPAAAAATTALDPVPPTAQNAPESGARALLPPAAMSDPVPAPSQPPGPAATRAPHSPPTASPRIRASDTANTSPSIARQRLAAHVAVAAAAAAAAAGGNGGGTGPHGTSPATASYTAARDEVGRYGGM